MDYIVVIAPLPKYRVRILYLSLSFDSVLTENENDDGDEDDEVDGSCETLASSKSRMTLNYERRSLPRDETVVFVMYLETKSVARIILFRIISVRRRLESKFE